MQRELMRMVADMLEDENEYKKFKKDFIKTCEEYNKK